LPPDLLDIPHDAPEIGDALSDIIDGSVKMGAMDSL
jgi:hypothetical protein